MAPPQKKLKGDTTKLLFVAVGRGGRWEGCLGVGEPADCHHRDWRDPPLILALAGIVGSGERRRAVGATACGVAFDLEKAAVWRKARNIRVTGAARLPRLLRETRQSLRRLHCGDDRCQRNDDGSGHQPGKELPGATKCPISHARPQTRLDCTTTSGAGHFAANSCPKIFKAVAVPQHDLIHSKLNFPTAF